MIIFLSNEGVLLLNDHIYETSNWSAEHFVNFVH